MKNLILLLTLLIVSGNVFAGVRQVSDMPGMESLVIKLDRKGKEAKIPMMELTVKQTNVNVNVIREHQA